MERDVIKEVVKQSTIWDSLNIEELKCLIRLRILERYDYWKDIISKFCFHFYFSLLDTNPQKHTHITFAG